MSQNIYLDGAQDVARAGQAIHSAANAMGHAAASIESSMSHATMSLDGSLAAMRMHMDDWLSRFEAVMSSPPVAPAASAAPGKPLTAVMVKIIGSADNFELVGVFDDDITMGLAVQQAAARNPGRVVFSYLACFLNVPTEPSHG